MIDALPISDEAASFERGLRFGPSHARHRERQYGNAVATRDRIAALLTTAPPSQVAELTAMLEKAEVDVTATRAAAGLDEFERAKQ